MSVDHEGMTKIELLAFLERCQRSDDPEAAHSDADAALLAYINDPEITAAYEAIKRWYA
jgi:hypothetical protein